MTGGSTIVEFWRDEETNIDNRSQTDDILLLKQAVLDIDEDAANAPASRTARPALAIAFVLAALAWLGFAIAATITGGGWQAGPAAWPGLVAALAAPLILLGLGWLLLARGSRAETARYLDTARALRTEADLLELRLGRIADQLEAARQTMQDQAELLDSYGAAASSNMEASAELIAARAAATVGHSEAAERAGTAVVARMDALIAAMPDFEDRAVRMAARIEDNGHALAARIDTLEARLHSLTELSDEARTRTLSATKSLSSQLTGLQDATRSAVDEVNGMADIASARIAATLQEARAAMEGGRLDMEAHGAALQALVATARADVDETGAGAVRSFTESLGTIEADLRARIAATRADAQAAMESGREDIAAQDAALQALIAQARADIGETGDGAVARFTDALAAMEADLRRRIDATLSDARETLAFTGQGLAEQNDALDALIARSRQNIAAIGEETVADLSGEIGDIEGRVHQLNDLVDGQRMLMAGLGQTLAAAVDVAESRFAALETAALGRSERLTEALARMTAETGRIDGALAAGGLTAEKLIGHAESLLVALDSSVRELDETYPAALDRFDARMASSRALLDSAKPEMEHLEAISEAIVGRTQEAEEMLRGQGNRLTEWLESTQAGLDSNRMAVGKLREALDGAQQDATRLTEGAGPLLITALLRVKDTADQAAERARQALGRAIPDAARTLAEEADRAMQDVIGDKVARQVEHLAAVAEEAVKVAHQASDRLMRQLLTIADTSASVEQRIDQAQQAAEDRDKDHFARRSALLIESLNSTAIDVAKILSNEVTDSAWSSYLKGDRGVFTRRAVKLLDAGESREIALHYDEDPEFQGHVNRYIHDFEAMLRVILSARDGNALAVAVLSSDMGKLYVALAQAIERLRQ